MANYVSKFTGPEIDTAVENALNLNAALVRQEPVANGHYILDAGKTYQIKNSTASGEWGFGTTLQLQFHHPDTGNLQVETAQLELPAFEPFADGMEFRIVGLRTFVDTLSSGKYQCNVLVQYILNGDRNSQLLHITCNTNPNWPEIVTDNSIFVVTGTVIGATDVLLINDAVPVTAAPGKSAYDYAVDGGYLGSEKDFAKLIANISFAGAGGGDFDLSGLAVRNEMLQYGTYYPNNRSIDDLKSADDVGFYIGDGYSLIVTRGSSYNEYYTTHQIKIENTVSKNGAPTIFVRQYYSGGPYDDTWTNWVKAGDVISGTPKTDASIDYVKDVPADPASYAEVNKVGGMTYKDGDTLRSAPVTGVKSVGVNLVDAPDITLSSAGRIVDMRSLPLPLSAGTYTLSFRAKNHTPNSLCHCAFLRADGSSVVASEMAYVNEFNQLTITVNEEWAVISASANSPNGGTFYEFMLNEGDTALPYAPYVEHTLTIPEAVQTLDGYGEGVNANCYNYIDWEKKQFVKRVEKIVFRGTESWMALPSNPNIFYIKISNAASRADGGSLLANGYEYSNSGLTVDKSCTVSDSLYFLDNGCGSLNEWKAYLAELYATDTPLTVVYVIATPEVTDISDLITSDNLIGVEGNGTITFENEHGYAVPSEVVFYEGTNEIVDANTFVGDLVGTAVRAIADKDGNDITKTYATKKEVNESGGSAALYEHVYLFVSNKEDVFTMSWTDKHNDYSSDVTTILSKLYQRYSGEIFMASGAMWSEGSTDIAYGHIIYIEVGSESAMLTPHFCSSPGSRTSATGYDSDSLTLLSHSDRPVN